VGGGQECRPGFRPRNPGALFRRAVGIARAASIRAGPPSSLRCNELVGAGMNLADFSDPLQELRGQLFENVADWGRLPARPLA
jgi:hypothetical protein